MPYLVDQFHAAVSLLSGHGHIKQRLSAAYLDNLGAIHEDELPEAAQEIFADLRQKLRRVAPLNGEGHVRASVRKMSVNEANDCAKLIVDLYASVLRHYASGASLRLVERSTEIPAFLMKNRFQVENS